MTEEISKGEGAIHAQTVKGYRSELMKSSLKFQNAMESYLTTPQGEERERLKALMNEQLGLIQASVREIRRRGLYKEDVKLEEDYQKFIADPHGENVAALAQDIETLREHVGGGDPPAFGLRG